MGNADAPFDGMLQSMARDAREKCEHLSRGEELSVLIRPLLPALIKEAARRGDPQEAYKLSGEALTVLLEMHRALVPDWKPGKYPLNRPMRVHVSDDVSLAGEGGGPYDGYGGGLNKDDLEAAAASYLARPWMAHDYLHWCLVDAMVRREWAAFDYWVQHPPLDISMLGSSRLTELLSWKGMPWVFEGALAAGVAWWLHRSYVNDDPYFLWWAAVAALYYGYSLISILRRARAVRVARKIQGQVEDPKVVYGRLLAKMQRCYRELDGPVLSPTRVRDELRSAEAMGIGWPNAIWPVLEAAITRNPVVWVVSSEAWRA